jgi:hypothetical protein
VEMNSLRQSGVTLIAGIVAPRSKVCRADSDDFEYVPIGLCSAARKRERQRPLRLVTLGQIGLEDKRETSNH